jgi:hypothetical protein
MKSQVRSSLVFLLAVTLSACGGSGGGSSLSQSQTSAPTSPPTSSGTSDTCSNCGGALVTITDAPGDFLSYIVNIVSLQLTNADGTVVQIVPTTTQVDFAQLVDLSEIVSAAQIPVGHYVSATLTLDYAGATIVVDAGSGPVTIAPGNIINGATSLPLAAPDTTQVTVSLKLDADNPLVVAPNAIGSLALDFNLAASDSIGPSLTAPTTVTVDPVLTASLVPDATKPIHVRGQFVSASTTASDFVLAVRPFFNTSGTNGQVTIATTAATTFAINGTSYSGSAGLTALAAIPANTVVAVDGTWNPTTQTFTATSVVAGSGVAGTTQDSVQGIVLSRTGDVVTLGDGFIMPALSGQYAGHLAFSEQVAVTLGSGTAVSEPGQTGPYTIQAISVGQRLQVSGTLTAGTPTAGTTSYSNATLDATAGAAALLPTTIAGSVTATAANLVTLNLLAVGGRPVSLFNFAGTGAASAQNATATAYTVSVPASLSTARLSTGSPVSFTGFVAPFGAAPPDFAASSLTTFGNVPADIVLNFGPLGVADPFTTATSTELAISATTLASGHDALLTVGFPTSGLTGDSNGLALVPDASATQTLFAIAHAKTRMIDTYGSFADLVTALATALTGTTTLLQLSAVGPYSVTTGTLSVDKLLIVLSD